ncbi:MAG: type II toxin-antitoxin system HicA family toxin [Candidatus Paceibacterota bacterium]|jgi:predicted RNA binding protein YcfA (HicA-like mRNA interferase family)
MPRGLHNWTFSEVTKFLKEYHFILNHIEGSHYIYIGHYDKIFRQVCVPFHGAKAIHPKTMKSIIAQSGISKQKWFDW